MIIIPLLLLDLYPTFINNSVFIDRLSHFSFIFNNVSSMTCNLLSFLLFLIYNT